MNTQMQKEKIVELPEGFTTRGAVLGDVENALKLFNRWSQSMIHEDEITDAIALRTEWLSPGFDMAKDTLLVFAPDGEMVGYVEVWTTAKPPVHPWIWARVDPHYESLGIGTHLLMWAEEHAKKALDKVPADLRVAPQVGTYQQAEASKKLFADMGYQHIRSSYTMHIDMDTFPVAPVWRAWRKRGLGLALLRHAFCELYQRGKHKTALGVDAENLTGALRLYENAGMHIHQTFDRFEKEIRPGKEISVQSL